LGPPDSLPTVYVVDDDSDARQLLTHLLKSSDYSVSCFESAEAFLAEVDRTATGCLLVDLQMPGMSGLQLHQRLQEDGRRLPTILITAHADVSSAITAIRSGVFDFVEKPVDADHLLAAVAKAVSANHEAVKDAAEVQEVQLLLGQLSPRQKQVLDLISQGLLNKQIADHLGLSIKTVEKHRAFVMRKMKADSVADLVRMVFVAERVSG
jgi:two-component system response regulator FixJ